jgi:outer membrane protein assembly factor BamB
MRFRFALSVPFLALIACTGASNSGPASATSRQSQPQAQTQTQTQAQTQAPATSTARGTAPNAAAATTPANWATYHGNRSRSGYAPTMPAAQGAPRVLKQYKLDGEVYASPLVIGGRIVVATENDSVYAIQHGRVVWRKHLGTPASDSQLPCGNIFPLGITGTPVYRSGIVYAAAELSGNPPRHRLFALRLSTGRVLWSHNLDLPGVDSAAMQERGALTYAGGRVWVPFGGLAGDCGNYKGRVVGVRVDGTGRAIAYTVPTTREAGIWTPPGPAWDGRHLFVAVGNGEATSPPYDKSDSVLKLDTSAHLVQYFAPTSWASENASDADLGSQGPAIVGKWVFADGKAGRAYVLNRGHLGGVGGQVSSLDLCTSFGGTAVVGARVYVPCTDGVRAVRIDSTGHLHRVWHTQSQVTGSPVVGGGRVWSLDPYGARLYALSPATGNVINSVAVGGVTRFATPAIYGNRIFVPTFAGLTVVRTS